MPELQRRLAQRLALMGGSLTTHTFDDGTAVIVKVPGKPARMFTSQNGDTVSAMMQAYAYYTPEDDPSEQGDY